MFASVEGGKPEPGKKPSEKRENQQQTQRAYNTEPEPPDFWTTSDARVIINRLTTFVLAAQHFNTKHFAIGFLITIRCLHGIFAMIESPVYSDRIANRRRDWLLY